MRTTWNVWAWTVAAAALGTALATAAPAPPDTLRTEALALNQITGEDATLGRIYQLLEDPRHTKPLLVEAAKIAQEKEQPLNITATYILARTAQLLRDNDDAVVFYKTFIDQAVRLQSSVKIGDGYTELSDVFYGAGKYEDCEKTIDEFVALKGDEDLQRMKPTALRQKVLVLAKEGKTEKASELMDRLLKAGPDNPFNLQTKARFLRETDKLADAAKAYEDAIDVVKKNEDLPKDLQEKWVNEIRYTLSGLYIDIGDVNSASGQLKALLEKDPDNAGYNNDLGYIWADHDMNLPESEKLIRKALDEDHKQQLKDKPDAKPDDLKPNPSYLDSLGWVLYKEKKLQEARKPLEEAVKDEDGQSIEIYDHLGEVLQALGDKEGAVSAWKKGLDLPVTTKREKDKKAEVEKKLKADQ
ncbi:MAG TPA: tetratricopeptide repeat protein [Gemmataceae bacterium]|nr:tetratricopeptide repeat protein [Gemmataceae bacterium]